MTSFEDLLALCGDETDVCTFREALRQAKSEGIDINQEQTRITLLIRAAMNNCSHLVRELLIGVGKEVGYVAINDCPGLTALHHACFQGHETVVEELVAEGKAGRQGGFDAVTVQDWNGWSALHNALYFGNSSCVRILLSCTKPEDKKALIRAVDNQHQGNLHFVQDAEKLNVLLESIIDDEEDLEWMINVVDDMGQIALHEVVANNGPTAIPKLLELGRKYGRCGENGEPWADRKCSEGMTALHIAVIAGKVDYVEFLLYPQRGVVADVNKDETDKIIQDEGVDVNAAATERISC